MASRDPARGTVHQGVDQLGDFNVNKRTVLISALGVVVGTASAFIAVALILLIGLFTNMFYYHRFALAFVSPAGNQLGDYAIIVPVLGGLIIGVMARYGSDRIRGHGIPEALESILINRSKIEPKVTVLKPVSTAVSIGSGGPFGAEGPIIMTGGALGSVFGQFLHLSSMERKTLLVAGAAGGMAATFNSPVAAVLLAVELLLFEWKPRSLIPVGFASVTATVLRGVLLGPGPLFPIPATPSPDVVMVASAVLVGLLGGLISTVLTWAVYSSEDAFRKLPLHWMWWPAIGGLVIGIGGFLSPRALGVGYDSIDAMLLGNIAITVVVVLLLVKATIWAFALGSGTSGGVLAPLLIIGGAAGAIEAQVLPAGTLPLWVLVSMGAMIGGTMRAPFTGVVFSLELTHDLNALLPLLAACVTAELVTVFTMKRSILTEKVARRGVHVAREYSVDVLEQIPVRAVMHADFLSVQPNERLEDIVSRFMRSGGRPLGYVVLDAIGFLQGYLTRGDLLAAAVRDDFKGLTVMDVSREHPTVSFPDEPLRVAADRMAQEDLESIPVVDPSNPQRVVGILTKEDIFHARVLWFAEEKEKEKVLSLPQVSRPDLAGYWRWVRSRTSKSRGEPTDRDDSSEA